MYVSPVRLLCVLGTFAHHPTGLLHVRVRVDRRSAAGVPDRLSYGRGCESKTSVSSCQGGSVGSLTWATIIDWWDPVVKVYNEFTGPSHVHQLYSQSSLAACDE
jgi:hypothetical protein